MWFLTVAFEVFALSVGFCQQVPEIKLNIIEELLHTVKSLETKIVGIDEKVSSLDNRISFLDERMEGQTDQLTQLKQQVSTIEENVLKKMEDQGSSHLETIYQTFTQIIERELELKRQMMNTSNALLASERESRAEMMSTMCNRDQVDSLQDKTSMLQELFETERESRAEMMSTMCNKDQVDSLQDKTSMLQGLFETAVSCHSPSHLVPGFGCVIPLNETMSWEKAKETCKTLSGRLLEGITTKTQIAELKEHFGDIFGKHGPWIGHKEEVWVEGGQTIDSKSELWLSGEPDEGEDCGGIYLHPSKPGLTDYACTKNQPILCQKLY